MLWITISLNKQSVHLLTYIVASSIEQHVCKRLASVHLWEVILLNVEQYATYGTYRNRQGN